MEVFTTMGKVKKVSIIGPAASGKTAMICGGLGLDFERKYYPTTYVSTYQLPFQNLEVYDFAGQEPIDTFKHAYLEKSDLVVICYGPRDVEKWKKDEEKWKEERREEDGIEENKRENEEDEESKGEGKEEDEKEVCECKKFKPFKPYELYCARYGIKFIATYLQCDSDYDFEQMKFSAKSKNSVSSFWMTVKSELA